MAARLSEYPVGCRCEVADQGAWRTAKVLDHDPKGNKVFIHFEGWASSWDEWVDLRYGTQKIAPLWTNLERGTYTGDTKYKEDLGYNLADEANIEEYKKESGLLAEVKGILQKDGALDEKQRQWLCEGRYVTDMLQAKVVPENWKWPWEFLHDYLFCAIGAIKKGLDQAQEQRAFSAVISILYSGEDGQEPVYYQSLKTISKEAAAGKWATLIGLPPDTREMSPSQVMMINKFGDMGGFAVIRDRLHESIEDYKEGRKGKALKGLNFKATTHIIKTLRGLKYLLHGDFMPQYFKSLDVEKDEFIGGVLLSLNRDEVYGLAGKKKDQFDDLVDDISSLIRGATNDKHFAAEYKENMQLNFILYLIKAPYIVAQRRAMKLIKLYLRALNPKKWEVGAQVSAQFKNQQFYKGVITAINSDGTYNVRFDDGDEEDHLHDNQVLPYVQTEGGGYGGYNEPEEDPPKLSYLDDNGFIAWLEKNKFIDFVSLDSRLFEQSAPIFKFLAVKKQLTTAHLDILLGQAKTPEGTELLSQLAEQMDEKTLNSMYKRQTEGIDYADYQGWQLDALTKFTLSAVRANDRRRKATAKAGEAGDSANYYGLNLFWDMLQPENESKLDKEITMKATACLNLLFKSPFLASKREEYINMCVKGLENNHGEVNALTVFQILMKGTDFKETAQKIEDNVNKFKLIELFFQNSKHYNEATAKALSEAAKDSKEPEKKPEDRILTGVSPHRQQLTSRLNFLKFLCQQSDLTLEAAEVDQLWELYVTKSSCSFDTELFMKWLPGCLNDAKGVSQVFSSKSRAHLFDKLASKHTHLRTKKPVQVTPEWQKCFTSCFLSTNKANGSLELAPLVVVSNANLKGKDQLWEFALTEPEDKVRKASQHFLGSMYIKFAHKEMPEKDKLVALDEFSTKCMSALAESQEKKDTALMQATLELLNMVLNRINVGEMIKRPLYKEGEKIQAHWKRDGGTLYGATIQGVNEDGTYHLLYADGDVDKNAPETYLREENGQRRVPEPVKLSEVEQHVQTTLAGEKKYFNLIFSSLDIGGKVGALAWELLLLLPLSDSVAKALRVLHMSESVDWEKLLPPAPVKLLYTLRIVDPGQLKDPNNPLNNADWCKAFYGPGLKRLASILESSSKELVADNLALLCLAQIHRIIIFFVTGAQVTNGIEKKDVLAVVDIKKVVDLSLKMVPQIVEPEESSLEGKAAALKALFEMLAVSVRADPATFKQIKDFGPEWEKVVVTALITNKNAAVQKAFTDGIDLLCTSSADDSEDVSKLREDLRDKLLSVTNARFAELDTQTNCAQYLMLMRNLIASTNEIEEKSGRDIGTSLAQLIKKHPMTEASPKTQDNVLGALLSLTAELIKKVPALRQQMGAEGPKQTSLLEPVYDMLFKAPTLQNSYQEKIRPPQCKHPNTRKAAFALLSALVVGDEKNFAFLADMLLAHHMRIHNNGTRPYSWDFEPAWRSDEQEREGYCGLVNCGNTCYINAALQQVFMQPKLRENILSVTEYAHPNPGRPDWDRDELDGLQWLLGNLQESTRRAIRPMYFHSRFEDPDWENQGKPIRGEGAAGHAQADSNGFLQTLMGRIEDRIKKTMHKDAIKSVCGLQFVDQIVGTRAAPYLNYNYGKPENWVGPISLNVNGHKTLVECLKSHVEWKQQNRKVSQEGIYGQKYEKSNVQIYKRTVFQTMPQCLMICLNRMGYDNMGNMLKLNHRISFPKKLNMKPYSAEALFGKLPRGSDIGATEKDSKVEIPKPSAHPDEYYEYELMGVIVHAGRTLQSGHYYSYIRERQDSGKWYCFNDSSISPFDPNKLEEETFGSADTDSWKCSTAYVLFYDKVPAKRTVSLKNMVAGGKLGFAGAAGLVTKLQKGKKDATEKVKARAAVPQGMLRKIWEENEMKWRDSNAHDPHYGNALWQMLQSFKGAHPEPPREQPKVEAVTDSPSSLYDKITRLVTRYLFMTLARSKGRAERGWSRWVQDVKSMFAGNVASSVWLVSMFINPKVDWFDVLLMAEHDTKPTHTPVQEVRMGAVEVLSEAMKTLSAFEKRAIAKASTVAVKRRVRSSTPKRAIAERKGKAMDEKKGVETKVSEPVSEVVERPQVGYVLTIIDRLVGVLEVDHGEYRDTTSPYHWIRLLDKFGQLGKEELGYLKHIGLVKDLIQQVDPHQERVAAEPHDQLPDEYFSLLLKLVTKDEISAITQPQFISRLLLEGYSKRRAAPICQLLVSVCREEPEILATVLNEVGRGIAERNHEITRPYYRVLGSLVSDKAAPDAKERPAKIVGLLLSAFAGEKELKFKEGDFVIEQVLRFAQHFPACGEFLQKATVGVERLVKYLEQRPEDRKVTWKKGDQVVAKYRNERGVYPGEIAKDNGDDTYFIHYDDGDTWDAAPGDQIRPRLFPRLNHTENLEAEGLDAKTVQALQFVLKNQNRNDKVQINGVLDEATVDALQELFTEKYNMPKSGKMDEATIKQLQDYLKTNYVDSLKQKLKGFPLRERSLADEWGTLGPLTKFHLRNWLDTKVCEYSVQVAKKDFAGAAKKHEAFRDELGFHKKGRRYTVTCEFAPYGRPVKVKVADLQKITKGQKLEGKGAYDSEDERNERKFMEGQKIDAYDDSYRPGWKAATVQKVIGDLVTVTFDRAASSRGAGMELVVTNSQWGDRRKIRAPRFHRYSRGDPHLVPVQGVFSKLKG